MSEEKKPPQKSQKGKKPKKYSLEDREKAYLLHLEGRTLEEISEILGPNMRTVWKWSQGNKKRGELSWEERDRRTTRAVQNRIQRQQEKNRVSRAKKALAVHERITGMVQGMTLRELSFLEDEIKKAVAEGNITKLQGDKYARLTQIGMANSILAKTIEQDRIRLNLSNFDPNDEQANKPGYYVLKLDWGNEKDKPKNMGELKDALPNQDPFKFEEGEAGPDGD